MQRSMALIVASTVLVVVSITVITLSSGAIINFEDNRDNTAESSGCGFEARQYCQGNIELSSVSDQCIEGGYIQQQQNCEADTDEATILGNYFNDELTTE